ncbi:hypothetical protein [Variovorax boronicumulans]
MKLTTAQIGRYGELLVQYELLSRGVESAPMSTDTGIDLVAFSPASKLAVTIQVKTNQAAKPSGGKGAPLLDWWLRENSPAQLVALVDMTAPRIWLFTHQELVDSAQQTASSGLMHIFMKLEPARHRKDGKPQQVEDFDRFLIGKRIGSLFGAES